MGKTHYSTVRLIAHKKEKKNKTGTKMSETKYLEVLSPEHDLMQVGNERDRGVDRQRGPSRNRRRGEEGPQDKQGVDEGGKAGAPRPEVGTGVRKGGGKKKDGRRKWAREGGTAPQRPQKHGRGGKSEERRTNPAQPVRARGAEKQTKQARAATMQKTKKEGGKGGREQARISGAGARQAWATNDGTAKDQTRRSEGHGEQTR